MIIPGRKRLRQNRQHVEEADNNKENENDENLSFDEECFISSTATNSSSSFECM